MKMAIILAGAHYAGKSKTIRLHLKPLLKISIKAHKFTLRCKRGFILSQSFEEAKRDVKATVKRYSNYDLLVFAARPQNEPGSKLKLMRSVLLKASFTVRIVTIQSPKEAKKKALEIFNFLKSA